MKKQLKLLEKDKKKIWEAYSNPGTTMETSLGKIRFEFVLGKHRRLYFNDQPVKLMYSGRFLKDKEGFMKAGINGIFTSIENFYKTRLAQRLIGSYGGLILKERELLWKAYQNPGIGFNLRGHKVKISRFGYGIDANLLKDSVDIYIDNKYVRRIPNNLDQFKFSMYLREGIGRCITLAME